VFKVAVAPFIYHVATPVLPLGSVTLALMTIFFATFIREGADEMVTTGAASATTEIDTLFDDVRVSRETVQVKV